MKKLLSAATLAVSLALGTALAVGSTAGVAAAQHPAPRLSMEDARRIALAYVPGGFVESIELDYEYGRLIYEVEVRDRYGREHELDIDAYDGTVLRARIDD